MKKKFYTLWMTFIDYMGKEKEWWLVNIGDCVDSDNKLLENYVNQTNKNRNCDGLK